MSTDRTAVPAPEISVLIVTRDRPALLARAIESALGQAGVRLELIVGDDGDGEGLATLDRRGDPRAAGFLTGRIGQVPSRNLAIARARGRWLTWLDDDDRWEGSEHLARMAAALGDNTVLAYASGRVVRPAHDGSAGSQLAFEAFADAASLRRDNTLLTSGIAYPRDLHARLGPFDPGLPFYWDWDWYLRLVAAGIGFRPSGSRAVRYLVHPGNVTDARHARARADDLARLAQKHGLGPLTLKNHEMLADEQAGSAGSEP